MAESKTKIEYFKTEEDYTDFMNFMASIVQKLSLAPLEEYIRKCETADSIGPLLDPTLWLKAHKSANQWLELARSLNVIKQKYKKIVFHGKN